VDLKADRQDSILRVQNAHLEVGADLNSTVDLLAMELRSLAAWLSLDRVQTHKTNAFGKALAAELQRISS